MATPYERAKRRKQERAFRRAHRDLDPDRIATVDAGEHAALAMWELMDGVAHLRVVVPIKGDNPLAIVQALKAYRPEKVIIEEPYFLRNSGFQSLRSYLLRRDHWTTICNLMGIEEEEVHPATWMPTVPGWEKGAGDANKETYRRHASDFVGRHLTQDEGAAVCIGLWYWRNERGIALRFPGEG